MYKEAVGLSMDEAYKTLLSLIWNFGVEEFNERTKTKIRALPGGYAFKLDLSNGRLPVAGNRRYWPKVAAAEVAWQFMGTKSPDFIMKHAPKIWGDFIENGELRTAYGYRWMKHFGRDQIEMALDQLRNNPTNRQLYVTAWDPSSDGLGGPDQPKNIPCPVGFAISHLAGQLHLSLFIRSSDVFVGLPYDVMGYAFLLDAFAASCGKRPGTLHVTMAHPHIYDPHREMVHQCLHSGTALAEAHNVWTKNVAPQLPAWSIEKIKEDPEGYIEQVKVLSQRVDFNPWNPMPPVIV
jgi:thymidylate synthase